MNISRKFVNGGWAGAGRIVPRRPVRDPGDARAKGIDVDGSTLVEALPVGFIIVDRDSVLTHSNRHFLSMLGCEREELIGRPLAGLICPSDREVFAKLDDAIRNGCSKPIKVVLFRKDGGCSRVHLSFVPPFSDGAAALGVCVVVTEAGDLVHRKADLSRSNDAPRPLEAKIVAVLERERQRIATDLHDGLGQSLTAMRYSLEQSLCLLRSEAPDAAVAILEGLLPRLTEAVGEVRRVAMNARPSMLDDLGIGATLSWMLREFEAVYSGITVWRQVDVEEGNIASEEKVAIYRIAQEAMNNVAKHANASVVSVTLRRIDDKLELLIRDNGCGFDPEDFTARRSGNRGVGLASIRDRVNFAGGTFTLRSAVGRGTEICVNLPLTTIAQREVTCAATGWTSCESARFPGEGMPGIELKT